LRTAACLLFAAVVVCVEGPAALAQTATLAGTVVDAAGQPLPGANVVATGPDDTTGTSAGEGGRFRLPGLAPGSYRVEARFVGYEPDTKTMVLEADRTRTVRLVLRRTTREIQEVVVTAQNRRERLRDVPISATVFSAADLEENRGTSVEDYAAQTPNLTFASTGRRSESDITIRGISNLGGQNNAFGVYVDGLNVTPASSDIAINPKLLDVERVEVLRGPQGTHFGRNAIAGAVSITTKKPAERFSVKAQGNAERFGTYMGSGTVNVPLADGLALRTTGFYEQSDGFIDDIGPANNTNSRDEWGLRGALRYEPGSRLTIDASASHEAFEQGYRTMVPSASINPALESILEALGEPGGIREGQGTFPENERTVSTDADFSSELWTTTVTGRIEYRFDSFSVISQTGWIESSSSTRGEADNTAQDIITGDVEETLNAFSQEVRVQSTGDRRVDWLVGANYADDDTRFFVDRFFGRDFPLAPFLPSSPPFPFERSSTLRETESVGVFGEAEAHLLSDRLELLVGLRFTHDDVRSESDDRSFSLVTNPEDPAFPGAFDEGTNAGSVSFDDVSPRVAVTYRLTESTNVFATVSRGFKAGGFNENQLRGDPTFDDEVLWNYETGAKGSVLQRRLRFEASLFWMDWSDLQVNSVDVSTGTPTFETQNAAEARSKGAELQLRALPPVDGLEVGGTVGYLDATFDRFPEANVDGEQRDLSGEPLPRSPSWTASGFARYERPLTDRMQGFVRGQVSYTGERFEDIAAREPFRVPNHTVVDVSAGVETERLRLSVFSENVFDNDHFVGIRASSLSLSGLQVVPRPRLFGVEVAATLF
jgi:iron complex outermembrane receptor protein